MIRKLRLERFKSFKDAELALGPFSVLVGTNASGKSNVRDALRFLHGVGRGYTLAEIFGRKFGEGGEVVWGGIRGGTREVVYQDESSRHRDESTFVLETEIVTRYSGKPSRGFRYRIEVDPIARTGPRLAAESLHDEEGQPVFEANIRSPRPRVGLRDIPVRINSGYLTGEVTEAVSASAPVLTQIGERLRQREASGGVVNWIRRVVDTLAAMRFLELHPESMRQPSFPGQVTLGDRGEYLSSVLQAICEDPRRKAALVQWVQALTPMDIEDFVFTTDDIGQVLVHLIEPGGRRVSAHSASDGTLRFLALTAALMEPD